MQATPRAPDAYVASSIIGSIRRRMPGAQVYESTEELYWRLLVAAAIVLCVGPCFVGRRVELIWPAGGTLVTIVVLAGAVR